MKKTALLLAIVIGVSCNSNQEDAKYKPNPKAIELNKQGMLLYIDNKNDSVLIDSAISLLNKATKIDSNYYLGFLNKIPLLFQQKKFKELLLTTKKLQKLNPHNADHIMQEGLAFKKLGDNSKAIKLFQIANQLSIKNFETDYNIDIGIQLITSYLLLDKKNEAKKVLQDLKKDFPENEVLKLINIEELIKKLNITQA
jgi:tetratricopeptide (TPR) repeat protein